MTIYIIKHSYYAERDFTNSEYYTDKLQAKIRCYHLNKEAKIEEPDYPSTYYVSELQAGPEQTTPSHKRAIKSLTETIDKLIKEWGK